MEQLHERLSRIPGNINVHSINVISSSKINKKVSQVLAFLSQEPKQKLNESAEKPDQPSKNTSQKVISQESRQPNVVSLSAKASVASKVISITEIVKRTIAEEKKANGGTGRETSSDVGKIHQYSCLHGVRHDPKTSKASAQHAQTSKSKPRPEAKIGTKRKRDEAAGGELSEVEQHDEDDEANEGRNEDEGAKDVDDEYFEDLEISSLVDRIDGKKEPDVPILTIYLSREPIKEMKDAFG